MSHPFGKAMLKPEGKVVAGSLGTWHIEYTVGSCGIKEGGGLRILPPWKGITRWEVGQVNASTTNPEASLVVRTENAYPLSYHWRCPPVIDVTVYESNLSQGDTVTVTMGDRGGFLSGFKVQARAQTFATRDAEFLVFVDPEGNGHYPRELALDIQTNIPLEEPPKVTIVPDKPVKLKVVARSKPSSNSSGFPLLVSAEDIYGNHVYNYQGMLKFESTDAEARLPKTYCLVPEDNGKKTFVNCSVTVAGSHYITVYDPKSSIIGRSNPVCADFAHPYRIYFGDLHVMTAQYSPATMLGNTHEALLYARDIQGLDFAAITNNPTITNYEIDSRQVADFNKDHDFVSFEAFEIGLKNGHRNVIYKEDYQPFASEVTDFKDLWPFFEGKKAITIPHHPNVTSESSPRTWGAFDWDTYNPEYDRLVEISQNRGSFETDDKRKGEYFGGLGSSVQDALKRECILGFCGGTDNFRGLPGNVMSAAGLDPEYLGRGGLTAILSEELTRGALWDSMHNRRCYATTGKRILLNFKINGHAMGETVSTSTEKGKLRKMKIDVVGTDRIGKVEIVKNNVDIHVHRGKSHFEQFLWIDTDISPAFYYVRVIQEDGNMAWASPIFFLE